MIRVLSKRVQIDIDSADPVELRESLLQGLVAAMRWYALCPDPMEADRQHAVALCELMKNIIPEK